MTETWQPRPGIYKMRLASEGIWVPVHILTIVRGRPDRPRRLAAVVAGKWRTDVDQIWPYCFRVTADDLKGLESVEQWYEWRLRSLDHARRFDPDSPEASPDKPVDPRKIPRLF